jgi:hypothetical protein
LEENPSCFIELSFCPFFNSGNSGSDKRVMPVGTLRHHAGWICIVLYLAGGLRVPFQGDLEGTEIQKLKFKMICRVGKRFPGSCEEVKTHKKI